HPALHHRARQRAADRPLEHHDQDEEQGQGQRRAEVPAVLGGRGAGGFGARGPVAGRAAGRGGFLGDGHGSDTSGTSFRSGRVLPPLPYGRAAAAVHLVAGTMRAVEAVFSLVASVPYQGGGAPAHMVVCGDDGLAHRLAAELRVVYGEQVTLVVPPNVRI